MAKTAAVVFGVIFLILGIWGFFQTPILGLFEVSTVSNVINIIAGLVLLILGRRSSGALKWVGIIYLIIAIIGFIQGTTVLGIMPVNGAANWLNLILGILIGAAGFAGKKAASPAVDAAPQM